MIRIISLLCMCAGFFPVKAQGPMNTWRFGSNAGIIFNNTIPSAFPSANQLGVSYHGCASVCDNAGQLLFYTNGYWIIDRNGQLMPTFSGSSISQYSSLVNFSGGYATQGALIAPFPGDTFRYYVFTLTPVGQLYYSVVDMRLNNGLGDVVPGQKGIFITGNVCDKMNIVRGCNNRWLVVRSRNTNEWLSFSITAAGINTTPVKSECGLLTLAAYRTGVIKFSPDGRKMAAASATAIEPGEGGLEIYDFDPFSGKFSNPVVLDTLATYGACFSSDNTKLYASVLKRPGEVHQYDLSQSASAGMIASRTLVLTNPTYWVWNFYCQCFIPIYLWFGELQRGPDGRIYIGNNVSYQRRLSNGMYIQPAWHLHVIHTPNLPGLACQPQTDAVAAGQQTEMGLPNDIVFHPVQDTVGKRHIIAACFRDSIKLMADTGKEHRWDDGTDTRSLMVRKKGEYIVHFTDTDCHYRIDTFSVIFNHHLPACIAQGYSCPDAKQGQLIILPYRGDTSSFTYRWYDTSGALIHARQSSVGDTVAGLNPGRYPVQLTTSAGCDTTLNTEVWPLPAPLASFETDTVVCKNDPVHFKNTSEALLWQWHFGDGTKTEAHDPEHRYAGTGNYAVALIVENLERCTDTAYKTIQVKELELQLTSDRHTVTWNEQVMLQTSAPVPYHIITWQPEYLFTDQQAYRQQFTADTTCMFTVTGTSEYGCTDTAMVMITVHPILYLPTAFSPNGDGRNDFFRPVVNGSPVVVRNFRIFDRWGREVWNGQGDSAIAGWDGTYNGIPAAIGTYFYRIEMETGTGKAMIEKGDVTLIR